MRPTARFSYCIALLLVAGVAAAEWKSVAPGVEYQRFREDGMDIHVARVDMTREDLRIVSTRESERGLRVSQFARRNHALVAINAGYFDQNLHPTGLTVGPCGHWPATKDTGWGAVAAFGQGRAEMFIEEEVMTDPDPWITSAVSGWPTLVNDCRAREAGELPGSDAFTRSPHPRTAIGFSRDGALLYFIVADGRRERVPGLALDELASWMQERLDICTALNMDGGGSSALWVKDRIVNRPSDGRERRVADHLAVVYANDVATCESKQDDPRTGTPRPVQSTRPRKRQ